MKRIKRLFWRSFVTAAAALSAGAAHAICEIVTVTSATPSTVNTGTYTLPATPVAQLIGITVQGTYLSALGGTCTGAVAFNRASLPASMAITGGGSATLPYTIQSAPGGGNTLLYTGGGLPAAGNRLEFSFNAAVLGVPGNFTVNLNAYALAQPGALQQAGSYNDNITLDVVGQLLIIPLKLRSFAFTVIGAINKGCTINGVVNPGADTATIPVGAGIVNTSPIARSYANAACNTPSNLQLTSQNGAVKTSATVVPGFSGKIDYSASASFAGASAALNTASVPTAVGPESGTAASTAGTTPAGTISVTITPQANSQPLLVGTYQDTLTITITPQ